VIPPPVDPQSAHQITDKPPLRDDSHFAAGKVAAFQYVTVIIFFFLISGFWKLQVKSPELYDERAQANSIKSVPILAPRGRILDRDGRVIVDNRSSFSLILARESLKQEHLQSIAQGLDLDYDNLVKTVQRFRLQPKYVPIMIKQELSPGDVAFVDSHRDFFPELVLIQSQRRVYPSSGMMAHVLGYTSQISEAELDSPEFSKYEPGAIVGKFGIEREYNDWLTGIDGQRQVLVDNRGQVRQTLSTKPSTAGKDLQLSIDLDLQAVAELTMEGRTGAVVALDPHTGEVLAMVSRPEFDPNKFAGGIKAKDWKEINENPDHPLMNKAIQAQQAPGSTFKPIVALAGLESGSIDDKFSVRCPGGISLYGHYYRCWQKGGHGTQALHGGLVHSCDTYFYTIGNKMGIDNISFYGDIAGFGKITGIDLPHENAGVMPSQQWKQRTQRQKWYAGETPSVAIGQGALTVTPLQLARAIGGMAIGGEWHQPHLLKTGGKFDNTVKWNLNPDNVKGVVDGMYGVVNEGGTGGRARLPNVEVCGKTGTAQLASNEYLKSAVRGREWKDNAWFVGFAPRQHPEIVVAAFFEHGEHGQFAAPIARDVLKAYFDKKTRLTMLEQEKHRLQAMATIGLNPSLQRPAAVTEPAPFEAAIMTEEPETESPTPFPSARVSAPRSRPPAPVSAAQ
jgi:penicillin-binding protein 2